MIARGPTVRNVIFVQVNRTCQKLRCRTAQRNVCGTAEVTLDACTGTTHSGLENHGGNTGRLAQTRNNSINDFVGNFMEYDELWNIKLMLACRKCNINVIRIGFPAWTRAHPPLTKSILRSLCHQNAKESLAHRMWVS